MAVAANGDCYAFRCYSEMRCLSRHYRDHPYTFFYDGLQLTVAYEPAESESGAFGGNSNWRGPIWSPVNYLIIESLQKFHHCYTDDFTAERRKWRVTATGGDGMAGEARVRVPSHSIGAGRGTPNV